MATLTGNTIASTYLGVLNVTGPVGAVTLESVTDGAGTATSLSLSQQKAKLYLVLIVVMILLLIMEVQILYS